MSVLAKDRGKGKYDLQLKIKNLEERTIIFLNQNFNLYFKGFSILLPFVANAYENARRIKPLEDGQLNNYFKETYDTLDKFASQLDILYTVNKQYIENSEKRKKSFFNLLEFVSEIIYQIKDYAENHNIGL